MIDHVILHMTDKDDTTGVTVAIDTKRIVVNIHAPMEPGAEAVVQIGIMNALALSGDHTLMGCYTKNGPLTDVRITDHRGQPSKGIDFVAATVYLSPETHERIQATVASIINRQ